MLTLQHPLSSNEAKSVARLASN